MKSYSKILSESNKIVDSMSRGKYKIGIDENLSGLIPLLKKKGYNCITWKKGVSDKEIHKDLHKKNIKVFFTLNYKHFNFSNKKYTLLKVKKNLVDNNTFAVLADAIECALMKRMNIWKKGIDPQVFSSELLYGMGCRMVKKI